MDGYVAIAYSVSAGHEQIWQLQGCVNKEGDDQTYTPWGQPLDRCRGRSGGVGDTDLECGSLYSMQRAL